MQPNFAEPNLTPPDLRERRRVVVTAPIARTVLRASALFVRELVTEADGSRRLWIRAAGAQAAGRLDEAARVLSLLSHPNIPRVDRRLRIDGDEVLSLRCDAITDMAELVRTAAARGRRLDLTATSGLSDRMMDVLEHAHAVVDPRTGRAVCMSRFHWANVLFSADGTPWLLGFGDDLLAPRPDVLGEMTAAPEVLLGGATSPGADLWGLLTLFRSLLPMRDLPAPMARVLSGRPERSDDDVRTALQTIHNAILTAPERRTQSVRTVHDGYRHVWRLAGVTPSLEALCSALELDSHDAIDQPALCDDVDPIDVGPDARWLQLGGANIDLSRRHSARRIAWALATAASSTSPRALSTHDLLEAGWPGERMLLDAGVHRVHVTVAQLRRLGLGDRLARGEHGYELTGPVRLARVPS